MKEGKAKKPKAKSKDKLKSEAVSLAMQLYLHEHTVCEISDCGKTANVAHHIIHQSRSNYLRCSPRNLCSLCKPHHYRVHFCGFETEFLAELIRKRGASWFDTLINDSHIKINDNKAHWEEELAKLSYVQKLQETGKTEELP